MSGGGLPLGEFPVCGTSAQAEAFRRATGAPNDGATLPLTFPMRWLASPDIRVGLEALIGHDELVLVHESQSFSYTAPLRVGGSYVLNLTARRDQTPSRLVLEGVITDDDGRECAQVETILRLIAAPGEQHA